MKSLDQDKPARVRQDAQERVDRATRDRRRSLLRIITLAVLLGAMVGFGAGLLVADRWYGGREVIFIPANGVEV